VPAYILVVFMTSLVNSVITSAIRLRYDYDMTIIRLQSDYDISHDLLPIRHKEKMNMSIFRCSRIVVVSQLNRSIISVVVECIVVSSYCSQIAIVI